MINPLEILQTKYKIFQTNLWKYIETSNENLAHGHCETVNPERLLNYTFFFTTMNFTICLVYAIKKITLF